MGFVTGAVGLDRPAGDPLRDDPATTQSEINEHGDGVRWSFPCGAATSVLPDAGRSWRAGRLAGRRARVDRPRPRLFRCSE